MNKSWSPFTREDWIKAGALSRGQQTHPPHGDASLSEAQQSTYDSLIAMGFSSGRCTEVAQLFGANLQGAINHLLQSNTAPPLDNPIPAPEKISSISFESAPPPELVGTFRITQLTKLLTFGYIRMNLEPDRHVPKGIQLEIVKYVNLLLVRLNYNLHGDLVSDDGDNRETLPILSLVCDAKLNQLAQCLEREGPIKYNHDDIGSWVSEFVPRTFVRIWMRFKYVCDIYPFKGSRRAEQVTMEDIMAIEEDPNRWVEVPDDCAKFAFIWEKNDIPEDDEPLEIALEFYDQIHGVWPSQGNHGIEELPPEVNEESDAKETTQEWRHQLKVGDFVDALDDQDKWYESVVKYIDGPEDDKKLLIHYIGWNVKWNEKISATNEERIQKRGTLTKGPARLRPRNSKDASR